MNQNKISVNIIKEEFDDNLTTPLEGWNAVTGDVTIRSRQQISTNTTRVSIDESVSNSFPPIATTSNPSTATTTRSSNINKTYPNVASIRAYPTNSGQGLVMAKFNRTNKKRAEFIAAHNNRMASFHSQIRQTTTAPPFNLTLQLKQAQEQLKEMIAKYDQLKLVHFEFETNANIQLNTLKMENDKLKDEIKQLKDHQQVTHMAGQELSDEGSKVDEECNQNGVKRKLDLDGVNTDRTVKQHRNEQVNDDAQIENESLLIHSDSRRAKETEDTGPTGDNQGDGQCSMNARVDRGDDDRVEPVNEIQKQVDTNDHDKVETRTARTMFKCEFPGCGKECVHKGNLKVHRRVHTREKPFKCTFVGCGQAFSQSSTLLYHSRVHSGKGAHACKWPKCGSSFSQKQYLTRHMAQVHKTRARRPK